MAIDPLDTLGINDRLAQLGISLPNPPAPIGKYKRAVELGGLCFLSGQLPITDGMMLHPGRLGADLTVEEGRLAARQATLNALAQIARLTTQFLNFSGPGVASLPNAASIELVITFAGRLNE